MVRYKEEKITLMKNTVAIIQARMGSKRLPGKMLKKLSKFSLIEWSVLRIMQSKKINKIVLATTNLKKDDLLVKVAKKYKISIFRGSEKDVLGRFFKAAKKIKAKNIIRICGDCPFIDPGELDRLITFFYLKKCDYVCNMENKLNSKYADGFGAEIFSYKTLKRLNNLVTKPFEREHVTVYIWKNLKFFKIFSIPAPKSLAYPKLKFFINTKKDYMRIKRLIKKNEINIFSSAKEIIKFQNKS